MRESILTTRAQPLSSAMLILLVAGLVSAIMLTSGRSVGAQQRVLGQIDAIGTRAIVVYAPEQAGVTVSVLDRIQTFEGVAWVTAFSSARDATNSLNHDGVAVPVRIGYGADMRYIGVPVGAQREQRKVAYASPQARAQLGLVDGVGAITVRGGETIPVAGSLDAPAFLARFEPLVFVPDFRPSGSESANIIVIIAKAPALVAPLASAVKSVLASQDSKSVKVETSEVFATLRGTVEGQLASYSRSLILVLLAVAGVLACALLGALVLMRRRDYGRRRALGASRAWVAGLVLAQSLLGGIVGALGGTGGALLLLWMNRDPLPSVEFCMAIFVLTALTMAVASVVPAILASTRDPVRELRVP